jgi:hypothetical protein
VYYINTLIFTVRSSTMVKFIRCAVVIVTLSLTSAVAHAENESHKSVDAGGVKDGTSTIEAGSKGTEVEVVSANGSITRAKCPHTCADRSIPKGSCREWRSKMYPDVCYVEDTSKPSDAIPLGK